MCLGKEKQTESIETLASIVPACSTLYQNGHANLELQILFSGFLVALKRRLDTQCYFK